MIRSSALPVASRIFNFRTLRGHRLIDRLLKSRRATPIEATTTRRVRLGRLAELCRTGPPRTRGQNLARSASRWRPSATPARRAQPVCKGQVIAESPRTRMYAFPHLLTQNTRLTRHHGINSSKRRYYMREGRETSVCRNLPDSSTRTSRLTCGQPITLPAGWCGMITMPRISSRNRL